MTSRITRLLVAGAALAFVVPTTLLAQNPSNVQIHNINAGAVGGRWLLQPGTATSGVYTITMPNASGTLIAGTGLITNNRVARFDGSGFLVSGRIVDDGTNPLQLLAQLDVNNFTLTNVAGTEVTVQDNLLVNSAGGNDLTIDEGGLTRVGAIAINPGTGNTLSTNGSLVVNSGGTADITLAETGLSRGGNIAVNPGTGAEVTTDGLLRAAEGVRITTGGLIVTAGGADIQAGGLSALGAVNLNTTAAANVTTIGNAFAGNTLTVNSATVNMANLPAGAATDAVITTDGTALRETTIAGLFGGAPWVVGGNTVGASGSVGTNDAFDFTVETSGATRLTFGAAGVITAATSLNMNNNVVENIGAAGTDFLAGGGLTLAGALTVSAGGAAVTGNSSINNTLAGTTDIGTGTNTGTVTIGNTANQLALASDDIVAANLPAGANTDALVTITAGGQLRETSVATMIGNTAWLVGGNATLVQATTTQIFGLPASGTADAIAFQTNGATRLTIGAASGITAATTLDMNNNVVENIGAAGTDFLAGGGLTLAGALTVSAGGAAVTGNTSINIAAAGTTNIGTGTNTGTVTIGNATNQIAITSDDVVANSLPAGANTDALVTIEAGGQLRETTVATMLGNSAWLVGGNSLGVAGSVGTNDAFDFTVETGGTTRLTFGAAGVITAATSLSMGNNVIENIGAAGTDFLAGGGLTLAGALTVSAGGAAITGTTTINNTAVANTTTIGDAFAGNTLTVNSATVNMANLPAGASTDAFITTDGTALRETSFATMFANSAWLVGGNTTLVQASATRLFGLPASGTADAIAFQTNGVTRLTIGAASGITAATALTITPVTNQIILGTTNTTTLNAVAPAASAVYTIPDVGATGSFVMTEGTQTINGDKTLTGNVTLGNAGTDAIQVDGDLQGAGANKFADRVLITGTGVATYAIANTLITANSVIIVTLEDGSNVADFTVKVGGRTAGVSFQVTLSAILPVGETKWVNYIIINP